MKFEVMFFVFHAFVHHNVIKKTEMLMLKPGTDYLALEISVIRKRDQLLIGRIHLSPRFTFKGLVSNEFLQNTEVWPREPRFPQGILEGGCGLSPFAF